MYMYANTHTHTHILHIFVWSSHSILLLNSIQFPWMEQVILSPIPDGRKYWLLECLLITSKSFVTSLIDNMCVDMSFQISWLITRSVSAGSYGNVVFSFDKLPRCLPK